jgi:Protein of unknown function (DUF3500)
VTAGSAADRPDGAWPADPGDPADPDPVAEMAHAVRSWLAGLDDGQRAVATFPFETAERFAWQYTPGPRGGLALGDMRPDQRAAALAIVQASLSDRTGAEVPAIIELEPVLGALERAAGRAGWQRRDPGRYWFAVFGDAATDGPWSWRVGGHHIAVQLTVADGRVVASAPSFLGANPAVVPNGPTARARALTGEETLARSLLGTLTPDQRRVAVVDPVAPPDILSGIGRRADVHGIPTGIRYDRLDADGAAALEALIRHYLGRARPEVAAGEWARIVEAGLDPVTFAWAGPDEPGRGHYYAVLGPSFLIEYDNTQDGANHIHSVWRDLANDWGDDVLAAHYRSAHTTSG